MWPRLTTLWSGEDPQRTYYRTLTIPLGSVGSSPTFRIRNSPCGL